MSLHDAGRKEARIRMERARDSFIQMESRPDWVFKIKWDADFRINQGRASRSYIIEFRQPVPLNELIRILTGVSGEIASAFHT